MIRAIFLDIDGTLVSFDTHIVPSSTIEALVAAKANGVQIFICTGRPRSLINNLNDIQSLDIIDGYITMNGAYCVVGDEMVYSAKMDPSEVDRVLRYSEELGVTCAVIEESSHFVCNLTQEFVDIFYNSLKVDTMEQKHFSEAYGRDVFQLSPFIDQVQEQGIRSELPGCEFNRWHPSFVDLCAKGNNKRTGIERVIAKLGISSTEILAIGDGGNDIPMLEFAANSVAMGGASSEVKSHAKYVTATVDQGGIAQALKHYGVI